MKLLKQYIDFYGVSKRIFIGFSSIIIIFLISVLFVFKIVSSSQNTLNILFDDHDKSVEEIYEFRQMVDMTKMNLLRKIYLPKDENSISNIKKIHKDFLTLRANLEVSSKLWDNSVEQKLIISDLKLFDQNLTYHDQIIALLPDFESHNDAMKKFESEDILEINVLPVLDKISADVQLILDWKRMEKEESRKLLFDSYINLLQILLLVGGLMLFLGYFASRFTIKSIVDPLAKMQELFGKLSKGELVEVETKIAKDEIDEINNSVATLVQSMKYNAKFAECIGEGFFDISYEPLSEKDELGFSLQQMNYQLKNLIESLQETQAQTLLAKEKAESALATKSQFLSVMSHEIRTPLNAIMGMAFLLNDANLNNEQKDCLATIQFSSKNLLHLINEILDLSKIEAGKVALELNDFDLNSQIESLYRLHESVAKEKSLKIEFINNLTAQNLHTGDSYRLNQVLNNLLNNAIKFTNKGGITFSVNKIDTIENEDIIEFKVEDSGIGIASDKIDLVFESFTQAEAKTTRLYGGTGLGLSICKKIIEMMGSHIQVTSELGVGSCFKFILKLPRVDKKDDTGISNTEINPIIFENKKILLVEDNSINAKVMGVFLKRWKINYSTAENGQIAVDLVDNEIFDLVLMDLQMPIMDGYEATKIIKLINPSLPVIALSAEMLSDIKNRIEEIGFDDYVSKPFDPQVLINKISYYISTTSFDSKNNENNSAISSFIRYNEIANHDKAFLKLVLEQVLDDFNTIYNCLKHGGVYLFNNKSELNLMYKKLDPNLKMLELEELQTQLSEFVNYNSIEEFQNSSIKTAICITIDKIIKEIKVQIRNI